MQSTLAPTLIGLWLATSALLPGCTEGGGVLANSGLDARPSNTTCLAPMRPGSGASVQLVDAFPSLQPAFSGPVALIQAPEPDGRWFVVERAGTIRVFDDTPGEPSWGTWIDISGRVDSGPGEAGLLGMALHPDFDTNGEVILSYTAPGPGAGTVLVSTISRFIEPANGPLDAGSEKVLLTVDQFAGNHNGGNAAFGPDGYLYVGFGDGGGGNDPFDRAQDNEFLLGTMIRIDVDAVSYAIPPDNPFAGNPLCNDGEGAGVAPCPEIYAYGLRNPWRWSFDRGTGALWLGDVGQGAWEEVDVIERGGNYGWDPCEGAHLRGLIAPCDTPGLIDPVAEYENPPGGPASVTGGYVYRGSALPELLGSYVFADFYGQMWALFPNETAPRQLLFATGLGISSFGEGNDGELYVVDLFGGRIHRLASAGPPPPSEIESQLSRTGCVDPAAPSLPASGLIPYQINAPFWSDGADKQRWLALPDGEVVTVAGDGDWHVPPGSVLMKHFRLNGVLVETRLLMRHPDGVHAGYSYAWDDTQSDATLVEGGAVRDVDGQMWIHPSGAQCLACHTPIAGGSLGLENAQLNRDTTYPSTGRTANQLATLSAIGVTSVALPDPASLPALVDPHGVGPLESRVRSLLHSNCAQCHRAGAATPVDLDVHYATPLAATGVCDPPLADDLGIPGANIVTPGAPGLSILRERMARRDAFGMPPLATRALDLAGIALIDTWINGLASCP